MVRITNPMVKRNAISAINSQYAAAGRSGSPASTAYPPKRVVL
jgi:hypothetical protein